MKKALITGITGQDGAYLAEFLLAKGYEVHGIKRRASSFNTGRIDHLYEDPHNKGRHLFLHYGDMTDSNNLMQVVKKVQPHEIYNLAILRVVFNHKDQSVVRVPAVGDLLNQQAHRIVVVGYHQLRSIHAVNRDVEVSGVIVHEANQGQLSQPLRDYGPAYYGPGQPFAGIEVSRPLRVTPEIRKRVVETAEVEIGVRGEGGIRRVGHDRAG